MPCLALFVEMVSENQNFILVIGCYVKHGVYWRPSCICDQCPKKKSIEDHPINIHASSYSQVYSLARMKDPRECKKMTNI